MIGVSALMGAVLVNVHPAEAAWGSFIQVQPMNIMDKIEDVEMPSRENKTIDLTALKGEYEPFTFSLYSERDCRFVVNHTGFVNWKSSIKPENVKVHRLVKGEGRYGVSDWLLGELKEGGEELPAGRSIRIWVTVHVPETAAAGRYSGLITIRTQDDAEEILPVNLEVLDRKLEDPPDVNFALLYTVSPIGQYYDPELAAGLEPLVLAFYRDLRAHGMTSPSPKCTDWPYREGNIEGLKAEVSLASEAGLKGPVLWYMSALINGAKGGRRYSHYDGKSDNWEEERDLARLKEIVAGAKKAEKEGGWPEVIFIPVDEPGTDTEDPRLNRLRMAILEKSLEVIDSMGARSAATITELVDNRHNRPPHAGTPDEPRRYWFRVRPNCHVRIYGYGYPEGITGISAEKRDAAGRGHEMWFYHNRAVMGTDRHEARTFFGVWGWITGARGLAAWTHPGARTVQWEIVREGIDDLKYLKMIEGLQKNDGLPPDARRKAEKFLEDVSGSLDRDDDGYVESWVPMIDRDTFRSRAAEVFRIP